MDGFDVVCTQLPLSGVERAVHNSPPPLDDVGSDVSYMLDEHDPDREMAATEGVIRERIAGVHSLLDERERTHGSFAKNAFYGQTLRFLFRDTPGWVKATDRQREALEYIAGKLSRILSGQPGHADHWDDIAGYAKLAAHPDLQR